MTRVCFNQSTSLGCWGHRKPSSKKNVHSGSASLALLPEVRRLTVQNTGCLSKDSPRHPHTLLCLPNDCLQNMDTLTTLLIHKSLSILGTPLVSISQGVTGTAHGGICISCSSFDYWPSCLFFWYSILYWASSALFFSGFFFQFYSFTLDLIFC